MNPSVPDAVQQLLEPRDVAKPSAHVLVDSDGVPMRHGGALDHFGLHDENLAELLEMFTPWFEPGLESSERASIPFLAIAEGVYAHVHFVADDQTTWLILVDATTEATREQERQQDRLAPLFLDLRNNATDERVLDPWPLIASLGLAVFVQKPNGGFASVGVLPDWITSAKPDLVQGDWCWPSQHAFLKYFMPDAEAAWHLDGSESAQSLVWEEVLTTHDVAHLQAVAARIGDDAILMIRRLSPSEVTNSANIQRANEQALAAIDAERRLYNESQRLRVTLGAITDGVLTTDRLGKVDYMNPAAELLTGWTFAQAKGKSSATVLQVVNESTGHRIDDPVAKALRTRRLAQVDGDASLVSRRGQCYSVRESAAPIFDANGDVLGIVVAFQDVTQQRTQARRAKYEAEHDPLTGLANRREFERRLDEAVTRAQTHGETHAVCFLDLNSFKAINDSSGHLAGDEALRQVAERLRANVRGGDMLARVGGDEFCVLLEHCDIDAAEAVAHELTRAIDTGRYTWNDETYELGVGIGLVEVTKDSQSLAQVVAQADAACYVAKGLGRSAVVSYDPVRDVMRKMNDAGTDPSALADLRDGVSGTAQVAE